MWPEFINFIKRGNVIDLAIAVVIGTAFNAIVTSLVNDIVMPLVGIIIGGVDLTGLTLQAGAATVAYGNFLQAVVNFFIITIFLFLVIRQIRKVKKPTPAAKPAPSAEVQLLTEIRDLLKEHA